MERYSFSKLSSFNQCPWGWYMHYVEGSKGIGNAFSSYGLLIHSILERFTTGELNLWDLSDVFEWEFEVSVPEKFPPNKYMVLRDSYYQQGIDFLSNFQGFPECKILNTESKFDFQIDDWMFNGVIDLVFEDPEGKLIVQDYKSKAKFSSKREQAEYARQLYLYCLHVKEAHGRYPDILRFFMFRKDVIVDIPFVESDLENAILWAKSSVADIRNCWDYSAKPDDFFCNNLCNQREICKFKFKSKPSFKR